MAIRRVLLILALMGLVLAPQAAQAAKKCDPEDPESCVQIVAAGEEVPFAGALMTFRRAARLTVAAEQCDDLRALDLGEAHELHQIQLKAMQDQRDADAETHELQLGLYQQREEELAPVWYEHPIFVAGVSIALTALVFVGAVETVKALK